MLKAYLEYARRLGAKNRIMREELGMLEYARSDLACEISQREIESLQGTEWSERQIGPFRKSTLRIRDPESARRLGKPCGTYQTVDCGKLHRLTGEREALLIRLLAGELRGMAERLSGRRPDGSFGVLVAGLGNAELTADAIGPKTVGRLTATRHLRQYEQELYRAMGCSALSALAPGVLGQTGIETAELLRGTVRCVRPDLLLVVDALSARSCARLGSTVQISDVGIEPGSGVGNHRAAITKKSMGIPVIALGVPTVVSSATLVLEALEAAGIQTEAPSLDRVLKKGQSFFVSPKESDVIVDRASYLLAESIGRAFTDGF